MPTVKRKSLPKTQAIEKPLPGESDLAWIVRRNVRGRRTKLEITQTQLAAALGISVPHLSHIESGRNISDNKLVDLNLSRLGEMARALSCDPVDLVTRFRFFSP